MMNTFLIVYLFICLFVVMIIIRTGRPRRCGWLDIPVLQYSHMLNHYASINLTKLDVLSAVPEIKLGKE